MITTIRPEPNDFSLFPCYLFCFWHSPLLVEDVVAQLGLTTIHCQTVTMKGTTPNSLMLHVQFFLRCGHKISLNLHLIRCTITTQSVKLHDFIR